MTPEPSAPDLIHAWSQVDTIRHDIAAAEIRKGFLQGEIRKAIISDPNNVHRLMREYKEIQNSLNEKDQRLRRLRIQMEEWGYDFLLNDD